ncbi:hypothetical protein Godav_029371 [Gossypium davidsonii]|uniref:Uncharacterized protein n=1 Tax=Gossypium davidsonii TaxID=34287 RepID=A0A7J8T7W4_GOSDV|nr:hypothetical protein [Gossypium davidsonii]
MGPHSPGPFNLLIGEPYTFPKSRNDSTEVKRIRYARAYILEMIGGYLIGGYLMPDLSRNIVHLRWLLKLVNFTAVGKFSLGSAVLATYTGRCVGQHHQIKSKSEVAYHYYNQGLSGTIRRVMLEYLPLLKIYDFY